jgi:FKBP-type peptidyl-prolyl cis-trans isomerase SlyD
MANLIQNNKVVSLAYTLKLQNGEVVDSADADDALEYLHGAGNIIPGLEDALAGLQVGDKKDVQIAPEDGYGEYDPEDTQRVPHSMFPKDTKLELGMDLMVSDDQGNVIEAYVKEIGPDHVLLDYNHPLAGESLFFSVEVLDMRDATPEEIEHGHPHGVMGDDEDFYDDEDEFEFDDDDYEDIEDDDEDDLGGDGLPKLRYVN